MQPRTEFAKLLPSVGVTFTVGAPASAAAASAARTLKPAALMLDWPTALDMAVISSFIARGSVRYAAALARIVGNEHAEGLTLNCACVGVRGLFAKSCVQATMARAPAAATMVETRAFIHTLRSLMPGRTELVVQPGWGGAATTCRQPATAARAAEQAFRTVTSTSPTPAAGTWDRPSAASTRTTRLLRHTAAAAGEQRSSGPATR